MGFPSNTASNAVIYVTYALFLFVSDLAYIFVLKANHQKTDSWELALLGR
jgi:hypothetical protein